MFDKIKPLGDKVLVKRSELEQTTPGGIILTDSSKENAQYGAVIAVGPGRVTSEGKVMPLGVKAGDTVFFGKFAGTEAGDDYLIVREEEILGVIGK